MTRDAPATIPGATMARGFLRAPTGRVWAGAGSRHHARPGRQFGGGVDRCQDLCTLCHMTTSQNAKTPLAADTLTAVGTIHSTAELRRHAGNTDTHWFDADTLRYFGCKLDGTVYGNRFFVSSEKMYDGHRAYSVREFRFFEDRRESDGRTILRFDIDTVGEFGEYPTLARARTAARKAAAAL